MYDYSGLWYSFYSRGVLCILIAIIVILIDKPWLKFNLKEVAVAGCIAIIGFGFCAFYLNAIINPSIDMCTVQFINQSRRATLISKNKYIFASEDGEKSVFYTDIFSDSAILKDKLVEGEVYDIYYDTYTNIIVHVSKKTGDSSLPCAYDYRPQGDGSLSYGLARLAIGGKNEKNNIHLSNNCNRIMVIWLQRT